MVTKTLTITKEAYDALKGLKQTGESFSQTVLRVAKRRGLPSKFFGMTKNDSEFQERMKRSRMLSAQDWEKRGEDLEKRWTRHH